MKNLIVFLHRLFYILSLISFIVYFTTYNPCGSACARGEICITVCVPRPSLLFYYFVGATLFIFVFFVIVYWMKRVEMSLRFRFSPPLIIIALLIFLSITGFNPVQSWTLFYKIIQFRDHFLPNTFLPL